MTYEDVIEWFEDAFENDLIDTDYGPEAYIEEYNRMPSSVQSEIDDLYEAAAESALEFEERELKEGDDR